MYKYIATTISTSNQKCEEACEACRLCKNDTREYDDCWKNCDRCNKCHVNYKNNQVYNEPYEYRPWFLTQANHSYSIIPYAKQFCDNVCGVRTCQKYRTQLENYHQCKRCQLQGKCWSPYQQRCIDCGFDRAMKSCESKYGCANKNGFEFENVPPINPMFNNCVICWDQNKYLT